MEMKHRPYMKAVTKMMLAITLLIGNLDPKSDPMNVNSFRMLAINLPARDGEVTQMELMDTPGVMGKGIGPEDKVLYRWSSASSGAVKTVTLTSTYPTGRVPVN